MGHDGTPMEQTEVAFVCLYSLSILWWVQNPFLEAVCLFSHFKIQKFNHKILFLSFTLHYDT